MLACCKCHVKFHQSCPTNDFAFLQSSAVRRLTDSSASLRNTKPRNTIANEPTHCRANNGSWKPPHFKSNLCTTECPNFAGTSDNWAVKRPDPSMFRVHFWTPESRAAYISGSRRHNSDTDSSTTKPPIQCCFSILYHRARK